MSGETQALLFWLFSTALLLASCVYAALKTGSSPRAFAWLIAALGVAYYGLGAYYDHPIGAPFLVALLGMIVFGLEFFAPFLNRVPAFPEEKSKYE